MDLQALEFTISKASLRRPSLPFGQKKNSVCRRANFAIRAEHNFVQPPKPPKGVTQPAEVPQVGTEWFGFVENAERLNSRAAMIGFIFIILLEFVLGQGLLETIGLRVGNGLPFEL